MVFTKPILRGWSVEVARIGGFSVRLHASLLLYVVAALLAVFEQPAAQESVVVTVFSRSILPVLMLFYAVFPHELAHALAARRLGLDSNGIITLWAVGGTYESASFDLLISEMDRSTRRRYALMVAAGPLVNLALGALSWVAYWLWGPRILLAAALLHVMIAGFTLLPIPRFDGHLLMHALGQTWISKRWVQVLNAAVLSVLLAAVWPQAHRYPLPFTFLLVGALVAWAHVLPGSAFARGAILHQRVADHMHLGRVAFVDPRTPARALLEQRDIDLWLVAQAHGQPKSIDRPYLQRMLQRLVIPSSAGDLARPLYGEVTPAQRLSDVVEVMHACYLPWIPVVEDNKVIGIVGYRHIAAVAPKEAQALKSTVQPEAALQAQLESRAND